jgi:PKD repeat protein
MPLAKRYVLEGGLFRRNPTVIVNQPPSAGFTISGSGLAWSFNGSTSRDPDGTLSSYAWDFGDGTTGTGVTTSHTYTAAGSFNVRLTVTDNTGATGSQTQTVTAVVVGGGGGGVTPTVQYRAKRVTLTATTSSGMITELRNQGLDIPTDANLVKWPYATPDEVRLNVWLNTLGANDLGVLPEFTTSGGAKRPYLIESSGGFIRNASTFFYMANMKRGLVGLGPNTVIDTAASSYTEGPQPRPFYDTFPDPDEEKTGVMYKVLNCSTANPYFGNMEVWGRGFGGVAYNFLAFNRGIYCLENVFFNSAHRGFRASPNGEAGAFTCNTGRIRLCRNFEVECRALMSGRGATVGTRVASSPWMFNNNTGIVVEDAYGHHANAGMPTCWSCHSPASAPIIFRRVRSEFNGGPQGNGQAMNWEVCDGVAEVIDCTLICNYQNNTDPTQPTPANGGLHMGGGSDKARITVNVRNATIDKGPRPRNGTGTSLTASDGTFTLAVQHFGGYTPQYGLDIRRYSSTGATLPVYYYGAVTAP